MLVNVQSAEQEVGYYKTCCADGCCMVFAGVAQLFGFKFIKA